MKNGVLFAALAAVAIAGPAQAASDAGLTLHDGGTRSSVKSSGFGVEAGVTLRFGDRKTLKPSERLRLGIAAGPVIQFASSRSPVPQKRIASLAGFSLRPGYSSSFSVAGTTLSKTYTQAGAAEADREDGSDEKPKKKKQSTGTKVAWVAAVAGGVMVVLVGATAIYLSTGDFSD